AYSENHKGRGLRVSSSVVADEADGEDGSAADARYAERCAVALRAPPGPLSPDGTRIAPGSATHRESAWCWLMTWQRRGHSFRRAPPAAPCPPRRQRCRPR